MRKRTTLVAPDPDRADFGRKPDELFRTRSTLLLRTGREDEWKHDFWTKYEQNQIEHFVGVTCFAKQCEYYYPTDDFESSGGVRLPKSLSCPIEVSDVDRQQHELTHFPFRSWCSLCVQSKSRQDHSKQRTLSERQPVI